MLGLRSLITLLCIAVLSSGCENNPAPVPPIQKRSWGGTDFSQLPKIEDEEYIYRNEDSVEVDPISYLAHKGLEVIRLKVWNNSTGDGSLEELIPLAHRIHQAGMKVMLTFHYSNTWADPGVQNIPAQWAGLAEEVLLDSVRTFTQSVVHELEAEYVQIGNEINHGMMKPFGVRDGSGNFQKLIEAGIQGARAANDSVQTIIHYAGFENASSFFATIDSLDFDAIGLSYYPRWHGKDLEDLQDACLDLNQQFQRPVYLVETSYPFTFGWADWTNNQIGSAEQILPEYSATPEGQSAYVRALRSIADTLGTGLLYWGGELVAYKGPQAQDGSPYENQALFNFNGVALPVVESLE